MDDNDLNRLLREWTAPEAPAHLKPPQRPRRESFLRWLLTGSIRVPVPVGLAAALLVGVWLYFSAPAREPATVTEPASPQPVVSLADFQPVEEVEVRVVGELK